MIKEYRVLATDTAKYQGSGDLEVLSTPRLVAYMENVAKSMIDTCSVGCMMQINHLAPTPVGEKIKIESNLVSTDSRKFEFEIIAYDSKDVICKAKHLRVVVDPIKFQEKANLKTKKYNLSHFLMIDRLYFNSRSLLIDNLILKC